VAGHGTQTAGKATGGMRGAPPQFNAGQAVSFYSSLPSTRCVL